MLDIFGMNTLARRFYPEDFYHFPILSQSEYREKFLSETIDLIRDENCFKGYIEKTELNKKSIYKINCLKRRLLLRQCSDNLKKRFNIAPPERHKPISFLIDFLSQKIPMVLYKIDIKSFFENCDFNKILNENIKEKGFNDSYIVLSYLYNEYKQMNGQGLPRGISIASSLSEILMKDFDNKIKEMDDVLYYHRYVDDIIVITKGEENKGLRREITKILNGMCLEVNPGKCKKVDLGFDITNYKETLNNKYEAISSFDFLGYRISIETSLTKKNNKSVNNLNRKVLVEISNNKIKKLKYKISKSFLEYKKNKNSQLLIDRIDFLSTNRKIKNRSGEMPIMTGLSYAYKYVDNAKSLIEVDRYLSSIIDGKSKRIGDLVSKSISVDLRSDLKKVSFYHRFNNRIFKSYSPNKMEEIVEPWK